MLNTKLHHVGLSWIIYSSKKIKYDIKENNHPDWLNKGPRYNTAKILVLNYFITIMKLKKNGSWSYEMFFKQIPTMKAKPLSNNKKTSCDWQILAVRVTWHTWNPEITFLLIIKNKYFYQWGVIQLLCIT